MQRRLFVLQQFARCSQHGDYMTPTERVMPSSVLWWLWHRTRFSWWEAWGPATSGSKNSSD